MLLLALALAQDTFAAEKTDGELKLSAKGSQVLGYVLKKPADSKLAVDGAGYVHPLATPGGVVLTDVAPADHLHHRGIFLAWFEMHGKKDADFWGWGQYAPKKDRLIVNRDAADLKNGSFRIRNDWMAEDVALIREDLRASLTLKGQAHVLELAYTLAAQEDVRIAKGAFSGFCVRLRKDGMSTSIDPDGEVKLPAPNHMKPETDWPAKPWYGYLIVLPDNRRAGAAVVEHPKNPPALWHNAASIRMLNPCITAPGDVTIKAGLPLVLRYRVVVWDGDVPRELLGTLTTWD